MGKGLGSPWGITAVIMIIVGIILAVIGIILLIVNQNSTKQWWIWAIMVIGLFMILIGAIILAFVLSMKEKETQTVTTSTYVIADE